MLGLSIAALALVVLLMAGGLVYVLFACGYCRRRLILKILMEREEGMKVDLTKVIDEVARMEHGELNIGSPQVAEVFGKLGIYLRGCTSVEAACILAAIVERAGKKSKT